MIYNFPLYNVTICNFCEMVDDIMTEFHTLCDRLLLSTFDKSAKRLLTHCIIQKCCKECLAITSGKVVFYYNKECIDYKGEYALEINAHINSVIIDCTKKLPISWYNSSKPLSYYLNIISKNQGTSFLIEVSNKTKEKYTFDRALKYINKHKLVFLNDHYFNSLKTRCFLLNT